MWISLIIFTVTGIQAIFEWVGKLVKNEKAMTITQIVIYVLLTLVILWITYGVATYWIITTGNVVK